MTSIIFLAIIFGCIVGSFLNVVSLRIGTGKGLSGRSFCLSCRKKLEWYEMIPIISFLIQRQKCRSCGSKISWRYFWGELVTGLIFGLIVLFHGISLYAGLWMVISSIAVVISSYDLAHKVILGNAVIILIFLGLFIQASIWGFLFVPLPFLIIWFFSNGKAIGFGDIQLMAAFGLTLGFWGGFSAIIFGFWIATLCLLGYVLVMKKSYHEIKGKKIPFAPFLLAGFLIVGITGFSLLDIVYLML